MQRVPPEITARARALRRDATPAERLLWRLLSPYRPRFTRQLVVGPFIVDFACRTVKLVIEVDGSQHVQDLAYELRRTAYLSERGWQVIRFWNNEVLANPEGVATTIIQRVEDRAVGATHPHPLPSREGRRKRGR
jgi:very-short-patch-repair endonuclease